MTRTSSILFWFSLIIIASLGLYRTSDRVQELDRELHDTYAAIDAEKQSIHVMKAEWVYLTNPARIQALSAKHLKLHPSQPQQVASIDLLPELVPTRREAMASVAVNSTPVATVHSTIATHIPSVAERVLHQAKTTKPVVTVASNDNAHLRDHMFMVQRTASAAPLPGDKIGSLISQLDSGR
jgi:hypothetical protein